MAPARCLRQRGCRLTRVARAPAAASDVQLRTSLIPETLEDMETDTELKEHLAALEASGQQALTREERLKRQRSLDALGAPSFYATCAVRGSGHCG